MRLVLDPADDAAHDVWLRQTPGGYEWWYFDALSDDGAWAMTAIWFLGNPFSPYYRLAALGQNADPYTHNAFYFALYHRGRLHAYHFAKFRRADVCADPVRPACLRFGPNTLDWDGETYHLHLRDENANRRTLSADVSFTAPKLAPQPPQTDTSPGGHSWLPAAPACRVDAAIELRELANAGAERVALRGHGYHDHNWGRLPFDSAIRDWYWARVSLGGNRALIAYHVRCHHAASVSHLLRFDDGKLTYHDPAAQVTLSRPRMNGFFMPYATRLMIKSGKVEAAFALGGRLDSAPFYARTLCAATWKTSGKEDVGTGLAEYFKPRLLAWPLVSSATKARIVDHARAAEDAVQPAEASGETARRTPAEGA